MLRPIPAFISLLVVELVVICLSILVGKIHGDILWSVREGGFVTWVSFVQLLVLSLLASLILVLRYRTTGRLIDHLIWVLAAFGFVILSLDEILMWHERLDRFVHEALRIKETALTDRLDDLIVGAYGFIGVSALYLWRREIGQYAQVNRLLRSGFAVFLAMVLLDITLNRYDVIPWLVGEGFLAQRLHEWGKILEESMKLIAEGVFIGALYSFLYYSSMARLRQS
jgi:hypothetical protein